MLREDYMPEAEVSLRLALHLLRTAKATGTVSVGIDGAQVKTGDRIHFPIEDFLQQEDCIPQDQPRRWQGLYSVGGTSGQIEIHSRSGIGDVVAHLREGGRMVAESKKGPLKRSRSSAEYPLIREAIGQLMTTEVVETGDLLVVAVPLSPKFRSLAARWRDAPLIKRLGIQIALVGRNGEVSGLTS